MLKEGLDVMGIIRWLARMQLLPSALAGDN